LPSGLFGQRDLGERWRAPNAQLVHTNRDQRVAIGQKGNIVNALLVPLQSRHFLSGSQIPAALLDLGGRAGVDANLNPRSGPRD
jgi:hypothetical protein